MTFDSNFDLNLTHDQDMIISTSENDLDSIFQLLNVSGMFP